MSRPAGTIVTLPPTARPVARVRVAAAVLPAVPPVATWWPAAHLPPVARRRRAAAPPREAQAALVGIA